MAPIEVPPPVLELVDRLAAAGFRAWVVGGCVRDSLMGRPVSDWDLATDATPDRIQRTFRRTIPTGIAHGTITVLHQGGSYEVTTLRGEGAYTDGRRPDTVSFVSDIDEDLARRDFTINAIAYDPRARAIVDPWGGVADLERRVLRAVRDPRERFSEDGLRVLRAARFVATLELELDPATEAAIAPTLDTFRKVSPERVRDEWEKLFTKAAAPSRALRVMHRTGMLAITAPAVAAIDPLDPTLARVDRAPRSLALRTAALLLDARGDHDAWMRGLRFSNADRELALHLLACRDLSGARAWSDADVRRFLRRAGRERWRDVLALARADGEGVDALEARIEAALAAAVPLAPGDLAIGGKDVMDALGTGPGRHVGTVLATLLDRAIEDPSINTRERLLALVHEVAPPRTPGAA